MMPTDRSPSSSCTSRKSATATYTRTVSFDPDDINGAFAELTARWIASGEVAHPEVIESAHRLTETTNRHDWDAFATLSDGATYVNHRKLASPGALKRSPTTCHRSG